VSLAEVYRLKAVLDAVNEMSSGIAAYASEPESLEEVVDSLDGRTATISIELG
jgi:hypothetical protein